MKDYQDTMLLLLLLLGTYNALRNASRTDIDETL